MSEGLAARLESDAGERPPRVGREPPAGRSRIEQLELRNGLSALLERDPAAPLVAVAVVYPAGSALDPPGQSGLAHLAEHLSYGGAIASACGRQLAGAGMDDDHDLAGLIESLGGLAHGSTCHDRTSFCNLVAAEHLELALRVEGQRMQRPALGVTKERLERERRIIIRELAEILEPDADERACGLLHGLLYPPGHPYHRLPMGCAADLERIAGADAAHFLRRYYLPGGAAIAVVGDFDPDVARRRIERLFAPIEGPAQGRAAFDHNTQEVQEEERSKVVAHRLSSVRVLVGYRMATLDARATVFPPLLAGCVLRGKERPLHRRLVTELGLARTIEARTVSMRHETTLIFSATGERDVEEPRLREAFLQELEVALHGWSEESLRWVAQETLRARLSALQLVESRAEALAVAAVFGRDPSRPDPVVDFCTVVSAEELAAAGRRIAQDPRRRAVVSMVPLGV